MEKSIKKWYCGTYIDDSLGLKIRDIPFARLLEGLREGKDVYTLIGVLDSCIRVRILHQLSKSSGVSLDDIYKLVYEAEKQAV